MRILELAVGGLAIAVLGLMAGAAQAGPEAAPLKAARGAELWGQHCASCHDHPTGRIPPHFMLSHLSPDQVMRALTTGPMRQQATGLGPEDLGQLAAFLTLKQAGGWAQPDPHANMCRSQATLDEAGAAWPGWGRDAENTRFEPDPGLAAAEVPRLRLKWAFAYPGSEFTGQPTRAGNLLLVPSATGVIFALDARTGCTYWTFDAGVSVKSAITIGPGGEGGRLTAWFGDAAGFVHAVDALTGRQIWAAMADPHPLAQVRGTPKLYQGRLYVPVSSLEEAAATDPAYPCCTFRGALVAFDAATGKIAWKTYTIADEPTKQGRNSAGAEIFGPSGASTWSSPTIDTKRGRLYIGTGNAYTGPAADTTDAVIALDLSTGRRLWTRQATAKDVYVVCQTAGVGNCPKPLGPDVDFGSSTVLRTLPDGRQLLFAGQKSGMVYAFDPDHEGRIVWRAKLGEGGAFGGVEHGIAADGERLYVPISDINPAVAVLAAQTGSRAEGGISALALATGERAWHMPAPPPVCAWGRESCSAAQPSAPTAMPGIVFSGSLDGHIRAYSAADGRVLWDFDTGHNFPAVNGGEAHGGAINGYGQIVSGGMLYVNSGGGYFGPAGNALLAFSVDGK